MTFQLGPHEHLSGEVLLLSGSAVEGDGFEGAGCRHPGLASPIPARAALLPGDLRERAVVSGMETPVATGWRVLQRVGVALVVGGPSSGSRRGSLSLSCDLHGGIARQAKAKVCTAQVLTRRWRGYGWTVPRTVQASCRDRRNPQISETPPELLLPEEEVLVEVVVVEVEVVQLVAAVVVVVLLFDLPCQEDKRVRSK